MTLKDIDKCISSPDLRAGAKPCDLPAGTQLDLFSHAHARVPLSARPAKGSHVQSAAERILCLALDELASSIAASANTPGMPTSGTSGRKYGDSSATADLNASLASRLRVRMDAFGSLEYALRWKSLGMLLGPPILQRQALVRRISAKDSSGLLTGWPLATASLGDKGVRTEEGAIREAMRSHGPDLAAAASLTGWPTPDANRHGQPSEEMALRRAQSHLLGKPKRQLNLVDAARLAGWATPASRDWRDGACQDANVTPNGLLGRQAPMLAWWPTPTAQDNDQVAGEYANPKSGTTLGGAARLTPGPTSGSLHAETTKPAGLALNPEMSRWLMGFRHIWSKHAPRKRKKRRRGKACSNATATPSCLSSQPCSYEPTLTLKEADDHRLHLSS